MKKILTVIISFVIGINIVSATNYVDVTQYNFNEKAIQINIETSGYRVIYSNMIETRDKNIILLGSYKEDNSNFKDNNYIIPGSDGGGVNGAAGGTDVSDHSKLVKLDSNYNKLWETDFNVTGNWSNASQVADTITTSLMEITELNDGSILAVGYTHGLVNNHENSNNIYFREDAFNPVFVRIDSSGKEIYRRVFEYEDLKEAIAVRSLTEGGYIIKYTGYNVKVSSGSVSNEKSYYGIYDSNNTLIELFPESENYKLSNYSFLEDNAVLDLKYTTSSRIDDDYWKKRYLGVNIEGNLIYSENKYLKSYDPNTSELINTINLVDTLEFADPKEPLFMTNDGGIFMYDILYSKTGEVLIDYNKKADSLNGSGKTLVLSNGDILISDLTTLSLIKPSTGSEDYANFIIDGKKVTSKLGTFIENNRTYININNLCSVMNCKFRTSEKNENMLIIDFPLEGTAEYTITHEIGSKKYTSYLSVQPYKIFRLISPTFDENSVDVTSKEIDGQVYVPLRFISEAIGRYVTYEPNGENGKPTIKISGPNEGEFYEKYDVAISYDVLQNGDILSNVINETEIELAWGLEKLVYGYGYETATKKVLNVENTVFVPFWHINTNKELIDYNEKSDSTLKNKYDYKSFTSENNWIGKQVMYKNDNGKEGEKYYGDGTVSPFLVVSNIEGYPFTKIIKVK